MSALPDRTWTEAEYLAFERASDDKHEFRDGHVLTMTGASERHNAIASSLLFSLYGQLRGGPCRVYMADMRVKVSATGLFTYPDLVVVCGQSLLLDDERDTLLNPVLIAEVLSLSTERYDRGEKFRHYRQIETLHTVLLLAQNTPHIERFIRQPDDNWLLTEADGLDAMLSLPGIDCTLTLSDIYENVDFA